MDCDDGGPSPCPHCDRSFSTALGLELHGVRVHRKRGTGVGEESESRQGEPDKPAQAESSSDASDSSAPEAEPTESEPDSDGSTPTPPPTEDEAVVAVASQLPLQYNSLLIQPDRIARVRGLLASARRKADRNPDAAEDDLVRKFWDASDRRILNDLRARGVRLRARTVGDGARGG